MTASGSRASDDDSQRVRIVLADARATQQLGERLGRILQAGDVLGLDGPLGAGKTCLVQGLAVGLGVPAGVAVTSPTFTLVNQYQGRVVLHHADLYRIEDERELPELGLWDACCSGGVLAVEWLSRFPRAVPTDRLQLDLEHCTGDGADGGRVVYLSAGGPTAAQRLAELNDTLGPVATMGNDGQ